MENSCSASHSIPCPLQTSCFITIFNTPWLTPCHLISLAHLSTVLTYILHCTTSQLWPICLVQFERHTDTPKWGTKKWHTIKSWNRSQTKSIVLPQCHRRIVTPAVSKIQGDSLARDPKLLSLKNYVIEIMTLKCIYTYRQWCKTGLAHNRCWNWSPFTSKNIWMRFSKFWNTFPKVLTLTAWSLWVVRLCGVYFCTFCPSIGPTERSRLASDREIWVAKFFWDNFGFKNFQFLTC